MRWNQRLIVILTACAMTAAGAAAFPAELSVHAEEYPCFRTDDMNLYYKIGELPYDFFDPDTPPEKGVILQKGCTARGDIVIPSEIEGLPVIAIGDHAFDCLFVTNEITSVVIPDTVTSIGEKAFSYCGEMTAVEIPDSVTYIGKRAFEYCEALNSVDIPGSVKTIDNHAFYYSSGLESLTLGYGIETIGSETFYCCKQLQAVTLPGSLKSVGKHAFTSCENMQTLVIEDGVEYIGFEAFYRCDSLKALSLPGSVTFEGTSEMPENSDVFACCYNLQYIKIQDGITSLPDGIFHNSEQLTTVSLPASLERIGYDAFGNCGKLTDIYYHGRREQWELVEINPYSGITGGCTIHCIDDPDFPVECDVDCDGMVTVADAAALTQWLHGTLPHGFLHLETADLNFDGVIDVFDLALLKRILLTDVQIYD